MQESALLSCFAISDADVGSATKLLSILGLKIN